MGDSAGGKRALLRIISLLATEIDFSLQADFAFSLPFMPLTKVFRNLQVPCLYRLGSIYHSKLTREETSQ